MSETKRNHWHEVPMPTRSSDVTAKCFGARVLSWFFEDEQADASYFILGTALHEGIEAVINDDLNREEAGELVRDSLFDALRHVGPVRLETTKRSWESLLDDAERMMDRWFTYVHPDSPKRHPFYDRFDWPPKTEVRFVRHHDGLRFPVWGTMDTVFTGDEGGAIVDWKSGVSAPSSDTQLQFYRFGYEHPEYEAAYHMLDRVKKPSMLKSAGPYPGDDVLVEKILETETRKVRLVLGYDPEFSPGRLCPYCPSQHICPVGGDQRQAAEAKAAMHQRIKKAEPLMEVL